MESRLPNLTTLLPGAVPAIQQLIKAVHVEGAAPAGILELVHLRASQINGCSFCVDSAWNTGMQNGMAPEKLFAVAAWREMPHFDEAERAALELAEHATRLADSHGDAVPDDVWNNAAKHFTETELASIVMWLGVTNLFNRVNVSVQRPAGAAV